MTPKEKAQELYKGYGNSCKISVGFHKGTFSREKAIDLSLIAVNEVLQVLRYFNEENAYREDMKKSYWIQVKNELIRSA